MKEKNGFTLLELLFVLGIIAIISVVFVKLILTGTHFFKLGQQDLKGISQSREVHPIISSRISSSKSINTLIQIAHNCNVPLNSQLQ